MNKIPPPRKPDEKNYIFSEGIDYTNTGKDSVWGKGDAETFALLAKTPIRGKWLNLAAGDGRYNDILLKTAKEVVAADIDANALHKLAGFTPEQLKSKLKLKVADLTKRLPIADGTFDGVFCVGVLHLFPQTVLKTIFAEISRVLKPRGRIIFELVTDVRRIDKFGKHLQFDNSAAYTTVEGKGVLKRLLTNFRYIIEVAKVLPEPVDLGEVKYTFSCNFLLVSGVKKHD